MNSNQEVDLATLKQIIDRTQQLMDGAITKDEHSDAIVLLLANELH